MQSMLAPSPTAPLITNHVPSATSASAWVAADIVPSQTHRTRLTLSAPTASTHWLAAAYDRATASHWESAWEKFVADAVSRTSFSATDIAWLMQRSAVAKSLGHRPAESLARVLGIVAERQREARFFVGLALPSIFAHPAASVRVAALEAMLEVNVPAAKTLARRVTEADHASLREAAEAVLKMEG